METPQALAEQFVYGQLMSCRGPSGSPIAKLVQCRIALHRCPGPGLLLPNIEDAKTGRFFCTLTGMEWQGLVSHLRDIGHARLQPLRISEMGSERHCVIHNFMLYTQMFLKQAWIQKLGCTFMDKKKSSVLVHPILISNIVENWAHILFQAGFAVVVVPLLTTDNQNAQLVPFIITGAGTSPRWQVSSFYQSLSSAVPYVLAFECCCKMSQYWNA